MQAPGALAGAAGLYHPGMAYDELLAGRVRTCFRQVAGASEKKMFGGLAFMTGGHLTVGVYEEGLIARIGAQDMAVAVPSGRAPLT